MNDVVFPKKPVVKTLYLLFSIFMFSQMASAVSLNAFQDNESPTETAYDSGKEIVDSRVDANGDGKLDYWQVKDDSLEIVSSESADGRQLTIKNEANGRNTIAHAVEKDGIVNVTSVVSVKADIDPNFIKSATSDVNSSATSSCGIQDFNKKYEGFNADLRSSEIRERAHTLWADDCHAIFEEHGTEQQASIEKALLDVVRVDEKKDNDLLNCLGKIGEQEKSEKSALLLARAKGEIADFYNGDLKSGYFTCEKSKQDGISVKKNKFVIAIKDSKNFSPLEKLKSSFYAGLLNKWGISGDGAVKIAQACLKKNYREAQSALALENADIKGIGSVANSRTSMKEAAVVASKQEIAGINAKLAETKVNLPSAAEASPRALAQISATQGAEAATTVARSQSSGLLGVANTVMGAVNTPASAASGRGYSSDSDSSSGSSSSSRSPASTRSSSRKTSSSTRVPALRNAKGVGADEEIVEEIDLTRSAQSARRAQQTPSQARNTGGNAQGSSAGNAPRGPASEGGSAPNSELSGGGGGSSGSGASVGAGPASSAGISGGGGGGSAPAARGAAVGRAANNARGPASTATVSQASREEIVTFLGSADYTMAKKKIRDAKFQESLKANDISIIDLSGNSYPPKFKGKTIFLDRGDRFVRQK